MKDLLKKKLQQRHREHVTLFLWENIEKYSMHALKAPDFLAYPSLRFDVDTPDDLYRLRAIVDNGVTINSPAKEIVEVTHKLQRHL